MKALRPLLARPRHENVAIPETNPEISIARITPSRIVSLGRPRRCTTPCWVVFATSRGVKASSAQPKDTCLISKSVEKSELFTTPEVTTPLDGAHSRYTIMIPSGSSGLSRSGLYLALTLRRSRGSVAGGAMVRLRSTRVLRCYSWRNGASLPGGTRLRIISHVLPPSDGSDGSPAADGGIHAGSPGEHGTRSGEESFGGENCVGVSRGCTGSSGGSAMHSGDHAITLSPEHILRVSEAYVEAWWRGVARGAAAAEEELKQLVVTASTAGGEAGGGDDGSGTGTVSSSAVSVISGTANLGDVAAEQHQHESAKEQHRHPHSPQHHLHYHHQRKDRLHRQQPHEEQEHHVHQEVLSLMPDGVVHKRPLRGYDALVSQLTAQHAEYHRVQYRPITSAASVSSSCGYILGEYRMQDVGGLAGHPATFRVSRGYCLFKLRLDPVSGRICRGWVRRQMTQEERDERVWDPVHVYPAAFPLERLHLTRDGKPDPRIMKEAACAWVAAQAKPPPPLLKKPPTATPASLQAWQHTPTNFAGYSEWRAAGVSEGGHSRSGLQAQQPLDNVAGLGAKMNGKVKQEKEGFHGAVGHLATARNGPEEKIGEVGTAAGGDAGLGAAAAAVDSDAVGLEEEVQEVPSLDAAVESRSPPPARSADSGADRTPVDKGCEGAGAVGRLQSLSTGGFISSTTPEVFSGGGAVANLANESGGEGGAKANALTPADANTTADSAGATTEVGRRAAEGADKLAAAAESPKTVSAAPVVSPAAETEAAAQQLYVKGVADTTPAQARLVEQVLAPDCRLLDAYGIWPDPDDEDGAYGVMYGGRRPQAVVGTQQVLHQIQAQHWQCTQVEPWLYDVAVSEYHNLAFVHWVNIVTPAQDSAAPKSSQRLRNPSTRGPQGSGRAVRGAGFAVVASSAATAAATAATAAAQAATAAADVATTAASAATIAATAAAFAAGTGDEEARHATKSLQQLQQPATAAAALTGTGTASTGSGSGSRGEEPKILPKVATADVNGSSGGSRQLGLQDLRIPMPSMPNIPQITQIPIQIQNLEEALSAAAQRVAGAAGTAAAAASAAAAAATAVIMAEAGGGPGAPDAAAAAAARAAVAAQQRRKEAALPAPPPPPPPPPPPVPYQQECMAALLFHDDGTVSDVWMFRGPFHYERRLLKS